jgi:hypothetical protein
MKHIILIVAALFLFSGCALKHDVVLVGFNTEGVLQGIFDERSETVTVTMDNGEILSGGYSSFSEDSDVVFSNSMGYTRNKYRRSGMFGGIGMGINFGAVSKKYALLTSETSSLKMEIVITMRSWSRNGIGEATTNDGRVYKIQF